MNDDDNSARRRMRGVRAWRRRPLIIGMVLVVVGAGGLLASVTGDDDAPTETAERPTGAEGERFTFLAAQDTNYCSLDVATVQGYPDDQRIQGSCCDPMDPDRYRHQLDGLDRYTAIPQIPQDPYDIEAGLAKELLGYDEGITLTGEDQATYDEAMSMTEDGGPCCCRCWRWDMTEGLAKFLITRHQMPAEEVAETADLTNGCGGHLESSDSS